MPIRASQKHLYPPAAEWKAIRAEVLLRANDRCEWVDEWGRRCNAANHSMGTWWDAKHAKVWVSLTAGECDAATADGERVVMIVLTIAHVDQDPRNNGAPGDRPNLKALCQRHHNGLDRPHRIRHAHETRRARKATGDLFDGVTR